jgi:Zn-dependent protease with chaperone function
VALCHELGHIRNGDVAPTPDGKPGIVAEDEAEYKADLHAYGVLGLEKTVAGLRKVFKYITVQSAVRETSMLKRFLAAYKVQRILSKRILALKKHHRMVVRGKVTFEERCADFKWEEICKDLKEAGRMAEYC